ncbi:DUF3800 domain-containing protein [Thermaerobacillus caldiproteolyticus]|uniref:DUF3800 domain-containing protein n=1 Tax=Thermaerobacillus caldiproteolyticus TaxID=247480 RepID=UPI00188BC1DE|nr:DUF3800 domain-containing protein [Anoxybacillus caldiproteolyticus]QPA31639.1 DUF3800 domain-containing protein [Anoxybacillus caldiproteolyticus]
MIEVYCDESRPEALYGMKKIDNYMVIGGIWIPKVERDEIKQKIRYLKQKHQLFGEIKWKNVAPSKLEFFLELVDLFFESQSLRFRCIVVDGNKVDINQYHNSDNELGFYKFYYQLLVHWLEPMNHYRIFLDFKKNKQSDRLHTLEKVLNNASFSFIEDVQAIESKHSLLIQLTDVLIGAVGYKYHNYQTSDAKLKLVETIEKRLGHPIQSTFKSAKKFNVFEIDLNR